MCHFTGSCCHSLPPNAAALSSLHVVRSFPSSISAGPTLAAHLMLFPHWRRVTQSQYKRTPFQLTHWLVVMISDQLTHTKRQEVIGNSTMWSPRRRCRKVKESVAAAAALCGAQGGNAGLVEGARSREQHSKQHILRKKAVLALSPITL